METLIIILFIIILASLAVGASWLIRRYTKFPKVVSFIPTLSLFLFGCLFIYLSATAPSTGGSWDDLIYMITALYFMFAFALAGAFELTRVILKRIKQ